MPAAKKSVYETLKAVEVDKLVKKKGRFNYLSWADAVDQLLSRYPDATWESDWDGSPYKATEAGGFVRTTVTVDGISRTQVHPILDHHNKTIPPDRINAFDVNTAIQRCLAKAISLHGLGIDIYRGEDINHLGGGGQDQPPNSSNRNPDTSNNRNPDTRRITEKQQKRMFAIAKAGEWDNSNVKELIGSYGYSASDEVTRADYEEICNTLEAGQKLYLSTGEDYDFPGIESDDYRPASHQPSIQQELADATPF